MMSGGARDRRRRGVAGVVGAAVLLGAGGAGFAACGGSSSSSPSSTSSPTASGSSPTTPGSSSKDAALARTINLRPSDFPSGWKSTQPTGGQGFQQVLACLHVPTSTQTADVQSPNFSAQGPSGGGAEASSEVTVQSTAAAAQSEYAALSSPGFPGCAQSVLTQAASSSLPAGVNLTATVTSAPAPSAGGNPAVAYQVNLVFQGQGQSGTGQGTLVYFAHGRVVVEFDTLALLGQAIPANLQAQLVSTLARRTNASGG
jgi:hypothetical protein